MDSILKTFSLGFLLRSIFAGYLFFITYLMGFDRIPVEKVIATLETDGVVLNLLLASLLTGATVYGFHRAILYPLFIEWWLNGYWDRIPKAFHFISEKSMDYILSVWDLGSEPFREKQFRYQRTERWGDHTHLQYTSSLSAYLGVGAHQYLNQGEFHFLTFISHYRYPLLIGLVFCLSGLASDLRLKTLREKMIR